MKWDTGISGSAAQKVGQKLREVSRDRQVICVTHLAQIAALADHQYQIKKSTQNDKTFTEVIWLDFEGRKTRVSSFNWRKPNYTIDVAKC